jgi:RNA polymerase sigma-70 factor (ECF subfamily)
MGDGSRQTVDDLIQETYLKLCADNFRVLRTFEQKHVDAFVGYIKVVTANVVRDQFKSSFTKKRGSGNLEQFEEDFVPAANESTMGGPQSIERAVLIREIGQHLEVCITGPDRERNSRIFWLHYRAGLSARAIAALPGVGLTTKGVESIIVRTTKELREVMAEPKTATHSGILSGPEGFIPG